MNADGMHLSPATPQTIPIDEEIKIENCIDLKNYKVTKYELVSRANEVPSLPDKRSLVCVSIELHLFRFRL